MKRWMWIGLGVLLLPGAVAAAIGGAVNVANPELAAKWEAERQAEKAANRAAYEDAEAASKAEGSWSYSANSDGAVASLQSDDTVRMPGNLLGSYVNLSISSSGGAWVRVTKGGGVTCVFDDVRISIDDGPLQSVGCTVSEYDREVVYLDRSLNLSQALVGSKTFKLDFGTVGERKVVEFDTTNLRPLSEWAELT